jgi:hypothetical protein
MAGMTGRSIRDAAADFDLIKMSVEAAGKNGKLMFANMNNATKTQSIQKMTDFLKGFDRWTLAAMTFKPGEKFTDMVTRVSAQASTPEGIASALRNNLAKYGVAGPGKEAEAGFIFGGAETMEDAYFRGNLMQKMASGQMNRAQYGQALSDKLQRDIESAGGTMGGLASGQDPLKIIATQLDNLISLVGTGINAIIRALPSWGGGEKETVVAPRGSNYRQATVSGRPSPIQASM